MDLFEYQARDMFAAHNVPVLPGVVAHTAQQVEEIAQKMGTVVVVKAQVKVGGRGKAGGVKVAKTPQEASSHAKNILGMNIKDHIVHKVMVTVGAQIAQEYYFSILLDRTNSNYLCMCSVSGGVDIEKLAAENPAALTKISINPLQGIDRETAKHIVVSAGFANSIQEQMIVTIMKLWEVFVQEDALLVEVNPLVQTVSGEIIALDGKVSLDENAQIRHPQHKTFADNSSVDPLEVQAKSVGLNYVKLDGEVGIIGNGAGLVMSTLDVVAYAGEKHGGVRPANFLDIGGGASAEVMAQALTVVLSDPQVKSVFVNVFGGITACDAVASGIISALNLVDEKVLKPLIVRLDGNRVVEGRKLLAALNHPYVTLVGTMDEAANKAAVCALENK